MKAKNRSGISADESAVKAESVASLRPQIATRARRLLLDRKLIGHSILRNVFLFPYALWVALNNLSGSFSVDWNVVMAGAVVAALPTALVYVFLGRFFVRGLLAGSVKG